MKGRPGSSRRAPYPERRGDVREARLHRRAGRRRVHASRFPRLVVVRHAVAHALAVENDERRRDLPFPRVDVDALSLHLPLVVHRRERAIKPRPRPTIIAVYHRVGLALGSRHAPRDARDERGRERGRHHGHAGVEVHRENLTGLVTGVRDGLHVITADARGARRETQHASDERRPTERGRSHHRAPLPTDDVSIFLAEKFTISSRVSQSVQTTRSAAIDKKSTPLSLSLSAPLDGVTRL